MKSLKMTTKVAIGAICMVVWFTTVPFSMVTLASNAKTSTCGSVEECEEAIKDLNGQKDELAQEEAQKQEEKQDLINQRYTLREKVSAIQTQIVETKGQIRQTEADILAAEERQLALEQEIEEAMTRVRRQMSVSQRMSWSNPLLTILSETSSLVDLFRNVQATKHVTERDQKAVTELSELVAEEVALQAELAQKKSLLDVTKQNLESQEANLETEMLALVALEQKIQAEINAIRDAMVDANEVIAIMEQQKNAIIASKNETFGIPIEHGYVTCRYYCYYYSNGAPHGAIDFGNNGNLNTKILASASGTVTTAGWHNSYGNYIIITHNINGQIYTTLYAHMSSLKVSRGDTVDKGQTIGTMGNTGNSTGPHLHFELYKGYYNWPYAENPDDYISFPAYW